MFINDPLYKGEYGPDFICAEKILFALKGKENKGDPFYKGEYGPEKIPFALKKRSFALKGMEAPKKWTQKNRTRLCKEHTVHKNNGGGVFFREIGVENGGKNDKSYTN